MLPLLLFLVITSLLTPGQTLPEGAPPTVCDTMLPFHGGGIAQQTSPSPFSIVPEARAVHAGETLNIRIQSSPSQLIFKGFMIHALHNGVTVIGEFAPGSGIKLINCFNNNNSTATHQSPAPKNNLNLEWRAPVGFEGEVVFYFTVAQDYDIFWVSHKSEPVRVVRRDVAINRGPTTQQPGISTTRTVYTAPEVKQAIPMDPIYEGCDMTKNCFGFPDGCIADQSCRAVVTSIVLGEKYQFEMKSGFNNPAYVSVGLSTDDKMGDDAVIECVPERGTVRAYTSYTIGRPNLGVTRDGVPQNIIKLLDASYVDGTIYCKVERDAVSVVRGNTIDLVNSKYHLLVAFGSSLKENSVGYHNLGRLAAAEPKFLAEVSGFKGASTLLLRLHAAFMLVAWIGTTSVGILLARYFKQTWVGSSLCGKDQWFAWHRTFMIITWSLTIAGFVIIFVEIGGWSAEQNPHAILGTITTFLCFIQPIGALFRPAPTHKNRPLFNWAHWLGGNVAHILAIVTIFFAVKLNKAELPDWFEWIVVAFVVFHVFMHSVLSIAGCISDKSQAQRVNSFPMSDISPGRNSMKDRKMDAPQSGLRKILLTVYLVIVLLFVVAMVVIATLAPIEDTVKSLRTKLVH